MIRLVDSESAGAELMRICSVDDVCACRIGSLFESYGSHEALARFWAGRDDKGNDLAVSLYGGSACIYCPGDTVPPELEEFIGLLSPDTLFSRQQLTDTGSTRLSLMSGSCITAAHNSSQAEIFRGYCDVPLREIYCLLQSCRCEDIPYIPYEDLAAELLHFQRFGTPFCSIVRDKGTVASFAMVQYITGSCAVIGAVCTAPDVRRQGLGGMCVGALTEALQGRTVYIVRSPHRNLRFYEKLGFSDSGSVYLFSNKQHQQES